jgi:hypothetical protein
MYALKPDKLNGQDILRPVGHRDDGTPFIANKAVFFPPTLIAAKPQLTDPAELVELAMADLISISERIGDPVIRAQAVMFRKKLKTHQHIWLARAAANEREFIRLFLFENGFKNAAEAL